MSSHRKPRMFAARKRTRAVTLCTAAIAGIATPAIASAATTGSAPVKSVQPSQPAPAVSAPAAATQGSFVAVSDSTTSKQKTYTVVPGDTLFGIAKSALGDGNDYPELFKLNKDKAETDGRTFTDANLIYPGWSIQLPSSATTPSSSSASTGSSSSSTAAKTTSSTTSTSSSSSTSYPDDLDGWINQAISILAQHGYTVSYNAIYQTAMNESSGNPSAENNWDSNAAAGTPSIGLMQVIQPTFDAYALSGYDDIWNPVDNIIAAAIYAQVTYGGLDNVVAARCGGSCWYGY
jgi:LysM repeat protein